MDASVLGNSMRKEEQNSIILLLTTVKFPVLHCPCGTCFCKGCHESLCMIVAVEL